MKTFTKIAALILAAGVSATVAGCSGCAGCNSNSINATLTNSNWYTGTSYKGIQPSFIDGEEPFSKEEITYSVTYDDKDALNTSYSMEYKEGQLKTEFYATKYDWSDGKIPESYRAEAVETVYCYKMEFTISVRYTLKTGDKAQSEWFDDSIVHESYFRSAGQSLQPLYSKQVLKTTTPANLQATTLETAYRKVDESYENFYNRNCTEVTSIKDGNAQESQKFDFTKLKNTLFDNSSLYIAVRSMRLSSSFSQSISLFSAAAGGVSNYVVSGQDKALGDEERAAITSVLKDSGLYIPAAENDEGVKTIAADINFAGGDLAGTTQTVWYAAIENPDYNVPRATMLKISIPFSFALGTLNFTLQTINSTLWND